MAIRGASQSHSGDELAEYFESPIVAEINITPLTDIFLVLLIIFMVTSSVLSQSGIQVQLPKSGQAAQATESAGVMVTVNSENAIFVNGMQVSENEGDSKFPSLGLALQKALSQSQDKTVIVEGDRQAVLGTIVRVMDIGKKAGALKFAVATTGGAQ